MRQKKLWYHTSMVTPYNKQTENRLPLAVIHATATILFLEDFSSPSDSRETKWYGSTIPPYHLVPYHSSAPNKKYLPSNPHTSLATCPALLYENSWRISHRRTCACPSQQTCWQTPTTSSRNDRLMDRLRTRSLPHVRLPQPKKKLSKTKRMICTRNGLCQAYR